MNDETYAPDYHKPAALTTLTLIGLGIFVLLDAVYIPAGILGIYGIGGIQSGVRDQGLIDLSVLLRGLSALGQMALFIFTPICFCMLIYRCARNARALGFTGFSHSPGWTVGWFFIPFAHLWMPYKAISEIWRSSRVRAGEVHLNEWWEQPIGFVFKAWWATWIFGTIGNNIASRLSHSSDAFETAGMWLIPFAAVLQVASGILCMAVVMKLISRQDQQARGLRSTHILREQGDTP